MRQDIIRQFEGQRVPRYTSYPTSPHFTQPIDDPGYRGWLAAVPGDMPVSLYLHVPFCRTLCWYCGCHTKIVDHDPPIADYVAALRREIDLVAEVLPHRLQVGYIHWGGGTPTIIGPDAFFGAMEQIRNRFAVSDEAEIAVEIDPRRAPQTIIDALAAAGVTRASLGVQSFDPLVQKVINRIQSFEQIARVTDALRSADIADINLDLIYGLPHQTVSSCEDTVDRARRLAPDRFAIFGYAHLPVLKPHQRRIDEVALPDSRERLAQFEAIAGRLSAAGYRRIGLDHFAKPDDALARCLDSGKLRRNFQGYTTDPCATLIGLGASAIGSLPMGYVQNTVPIRDYRNTLAAGQLPVRRSRKLTLEDRLRGHVIERIMCDFRVDLGEAIARHGSAAAGFDAELETLRALEREGIVRLEGTAIRIEEPFWPLARSIAALFDAYLQPEGQRYATAV